MRLPWLTLLCCSCLVSCDKVKQAVADAKAKATSASSPDKKATEEKAAAAAIDPALEAQIDKTEEGVRFRKDLPFPAKLTAREVTKMDGKSLRLTKHSELGNETGTFNGSTETTHLWKREGDRLSLTIERDAFVPAMLPQQGKEPAPQPVAVESEATGLSATFRQTGGKWKAENGRGGDFRRIVWVENVEPGIGDMAVAAGALPCGFWFGKPRFKEGAAFPLTGDGLRLLFGESPAGKIDLVYEGIEGIGGHPCGRFSFRGTCSRKNVIGSDGKKSNFDYTIDSGKIWLSLLYPVVMKREMEAILTMTQNSGGVSTRMQGPASFSTTVEWKPGT
ncbi:hypothetical protein [Luteolibacter sp. LG18]|uniref:hypothetical protein n=1 Tax=Luteolibacter sp. LG18 TaxID=2819286 RepID=UPI002B27E4A9|nr:hypothetical protein llg_03110 [Luteolibacter sp. LG18]